MPPRITLLPFHTAIRKRPRMFFPGPADRILATALREAFCHAAEELVLHRATAVTLATSEDGGFSVTDDGAGWPTTRDPHYRSALERIVTAPHGGCRAEHQLKLVHDHVCVMSLAALNALCASLVADNFRDGKHTRLRCRAGRAVAPLRLVGPTDRSGVTLTFMPDYSILGPQRFSPSALRRWWNALPVELPARSLRIRRA